MSFSSSQIAFAPNGLTVALAANNPSPTGVQALPTYPNADVGQFRIVNTSTTLTAHIGWGVTAGAAQTNAAAAAAGVPAAGLPILPNADAVIRLAPGAFLSAFATGATTVFVTPGQGL